MNLADYQRELVKQIYSLLVNEDINRGITLYGDTGCGKSTIARGIAEQLQEGWSVFYIEGINPDLSPYLTWHIGTKLHSKQKLNFGSEVSFGISFPPIPISLEFGGALQRNEQNYVLTPSEEAIISGIKRQVGANYNILFIADNYELWDIPSKQLLQKIMLPQLELLSDFHLTVLIISHKKLSIEDNIQWDNIPILEISDDSLLFVLRQCGHSGQINIRDIRLCAGNDLSLALMATDYYDRNNSDIRDFDFNEILDRRYKSLPLEEHKACKVLEPLSIIDSYFTKDETAFFIDPAPKDKTEAEYQAEEYLALAEGKMFIVGGEGYHFTSDKVKAYFKTQLLRREKLYHRKFAGYLQKRHPEDYFNRGKHLKLSLQTNDPKVILEAWQLLFLSYIRRASEVGDAEDIYQILLDIDALLNRLNPGLAETQRYVLSELHAGYKEFSEYRYTKALYHLQAITASQLVPACLAEVQRLTLLCHTQLAENLSIIMKRAEELYDTINDDQFFEDEQYCRAALVLLDVYIDRSNDTQKVRVLHKKLIHIIQQHPDCPAFEEFEACYNRKSALYFTAVIASRQTSQSIQFYRNHHRRSGLYMALCNHSGNTIVSGDYTAAEQALAECMDMLKHNMGMYYPSSYKVENNRILLTYLQDERKAAGNRDELLIAAKKAVTALSKIVDRQEDEVSHVVFFNYLGLSILCGSPTWSSELAKANLRLAETDEYYQYFLHDLNFASALLQGDFDTAHSELTKLKNLDVPLLRDYKQIFFRRQCGQELLLKDPKQLNGDPLKYHEIISAECFHVQDPSCRFFGRGFLLSDLQFLSF